MTEALGSRVMSSSPALRGTPLGKGRIQPNVRAAIIADMMANLPGIGFEANISAIDTENSPPIPNANRIVPRILIPDPVRVMEISRGG